jgi:hypothetical protein
MSSIQVADLLPGLFFWPLLGPDHNAANGTCRSRACSEPKEHRRGAAECSEMSCILSLSLPW